MKKKVFGFLLLAFLFGCAGKPTKLPTGLTANDFWKEQKLRETKVKSFSGKLVLNLDGQGERVSGSGRVAASDENHSRLEIRDPLGRAQYTLAQTPKKISVYVPSAKRLYEDNEEGRNYFKKTLGVKVSIKTLRKLWLGQVPLKTGTPFESWSWDPEGEGFRALQKLGGEETQVLVDGDTGALKQVIMKNREGAFQVDYSEYEGVGGIALGHVVKLTIPQSKDKLNVEWEDLRWEFSGDKENLTRVDVAKGTEVVSLALKK